MCGPHTTVTESVKNEAEKTTPRTVGKVGKPLLDARQRWTPCEPDYQRLVDTHAIFGEEGAGGGGSGTWTTAHQGESDVEHAISHGSGNGKVKAAVGKHL